MREEDLARGRQPHAARQALEQRLAELLLQDQDLPVDGRRGDVKSGPRRADRPAAGHLVDVVQQA
nr:hypothetical protein [Streptomyces coryli]